MSKNNIPVPVYDYTRVPAGSKISQNSISSGTPSYWIPSVGGGRIINNGSITFGIVMPNGQYAHGGVLTHINGVGNVAIYHHYLSRI